MSGLYNEEKAKLKYKSMSAHEKLIEELVAINLAPAVKDLNQAELDTAVPTITSSE
jgi:hypothetical protein